MKKILVDEETVRAIQPSTENGTLDYQYFITKSLKISSKDETFVDDVIPFPVLP